MIREDFHCQATENDVVRALAIAPFQGWPQDEAELLHLLNAMLEVIAQRMGRQTMLFTMVQAMLA